MTLYKILIRPIALYANKIQAIIKSDGKELGVFEWKIFRKIFGPKKNDKGEFEVRTNE